jgi:hypothetical protein
MRQGMRVERGDRPRTQVRDRADVEDDGPIRELSHQRRILDRADPVPDAVGAERLERAADRRRAGVLACVRHGAQPLGLRQCEHLGVRLRRELRLQSAEPDADHAALAVLRRVRTTVCAFVQLRAAVDVRREADRDPVQLLGFLGAVAVAAEDLVPVHAARDALRRGEDALEVNGPVRGGLGCVVDDDPTEVVRVRKACVVRIQTSMKCSKSRNS